MNSFFKILSLQTKSLLDIIDITDKIKAFVKEAKIKDGLINIQSLHTTATVFVNENEPLLLEDLKKHLERIAPVNNVYEHDDFEKRTVNMCEDECANGHSHCKAIHLPTSVCLNIKDNKIQFGPWQSIMFIELDRARKREIQIQILGE
ncbi:secondary thiamine-phosphate synthase enzyme YjbQ [Patescibacteria group bacterium]|nr:secondary thiamine-phosphate synthase enzyme YjbQ [Patescibacteria group bacterium]MBU4078315.1 secondary thiamine-phosphate synthase enzyme YjbQ [Patescibacteria group bacterium]